MGTIRNFAVISHGHAFLFYVPKLVNYGSSNKHSPMSNYNEKKVVSCHKWAMVSKYLY